MRLRRFAALVALCALIAPGTWLRQEVSRAMPGPDAISVEQVAGASSTDNPAWRVEGVWHYQGEGLYFGGFSAIFALGDKTLRAFSDRGVRYTFAVPDLADGKERRRPVTRQLVPTALMYDLWDIESATRDPATGTYWLGYENRHAIHRFSVASEPETMRDLGRRFDWYANAGLEAMERLSDGRFMALGEGQDYGLIFAGDPVEGEGDDKVNGADPDTFPFTNPAPGFVASDMAQLPDGRVLVLMRRVVRGIPPFEALIAIGEPPATGSREAWSPEVALRLDGVIPAENYEGMAVRALDNGEVVVWLIADDNFAVLQRTLLAKLIFDPSA